MANDISLTGLTEILYKARDQVAREGTAFINGSIVNGGAEGVSIGGTVTSLRTTEPTLVTSYTPSMTVPAAADITTGVDTMVIDKVAGVPIPLKGEQWLQLVNTVGAEEALDQLYKQAIRKMVNAIEVEAATAAYKGSSRAVGTAGTTPFSSNFEVINDLRQILFDNGCDMSDGLLTLALSSSAGTLLRNRFSKVNESGTDITARRGEIVNISGFSIKESAGIQTHTKGAGTGYLINNASGYAIGDRTFAVDGGTVNTTGIKAGDIITVAADASAGAYVVNTALTAVSGSLVVNYPGLRGTIADNAAITVGNSYTANVGWHKSAIEIAMRPPAQPPGGDAGTEIATMTDPVSGLSFSARLYKGDGMNIIRLMCFYGVKVWKPEFVATLRG